MGTNQNITNNQIRRFVVALGFVASSCAFAGGPAVNDSTKEVNIDELAKAHLFNQQFAVIKMEQYVPTDLGPTNDQNKVARKVLERSIQSWLDEQIARGTLIGSSAQALEDSLSKDVVLNKSQSNQDPQQTVKFRVRPASNMASIQYTGFFVARYTHSLAGKTNTVELTKAIGNKVISLSQTRNTKEKRQILAINWSF